MLEKAAWSSQEVFNGLASYRNNSATEKSHQLLSFASVCPVLIQLLKLLVGNWGILNKSVSGRSATFEPSWSARHPRTYTEESYWPTSLWEKPISPLTSNHFEKDSGPVFKPKLIEPISTDVDVGRWGEEGQACCKITFHGTEDKSKFRSFSHFAWVISKASCYRQFNSTRILRANFHFLLKLITLSSL